MLPTSHSASQPFWHGPAHTAHPRIQGLSLSVATGPGGARGFAYGSPPLPARGSLPTAHGDPVMRPAAPLRTLEQHLSPLPARVPSRGLDAVGVDLGRSMGTTMSGAFGHNPRARPEPISTKLKPCPACSILETSQGLCQNRALGAGNCPIRLLPGSAGPAPPFAPCSAQEEVAKRVGPAVNITENRAQY